MQPEVAMLDVIFISTNEITGLSGIQPQIHVSDIRPAVASSYVTAAAVVVSASNVESLRCH